MFHVVIPARFAAARLPGKPLLPIGDRPMVQWVWQRARDSGAASVIVATDDERIRAAALEFGAEVVMTSANHPSGTDRIAEVVRTKNWAADDIIVNLQGDEPMMPSAVIAQVAAELTVAHVDIATAAAPVRGLHEYLDPNCVKVVCARDGRALYFSRAPLPWHRDHALSNHAASDRSTQGWPTHFEGALRHIGIYAYRVRSLNQFAAWSPSRLESAEKLEQLRALENGMHIQVVALAEAPAAGIDTPADLERVRACFDAAPGDRPPRLAG
jgi:3-deoxy-manno-octulosonate cytidylyltransferase (CMP-KDO synthetase)